MFIKFEQDIRLTGNKHIDDYGHIVLLNTILDSYYNAKYTIKYSKYNTDVEATYNALKSKKWGVHLMIRLG